MDKIKRYSLVDEAYKRIKEDILKDQFSEGKKIPSENQLCKELSVSRVVVREALSRLRSERVIVTYQGKGSFRANPLNFPERKGDGAMGFDGYARIMEFREAIEFAAINLAVVNATDEELNALTDIAKKMNAARSNYRDFTLVDYEFHSRIVFCSHNKYMIEAHENSKGAILAALDCMNMLGGGYDYAVDLHEKIALSLVNRDAKTAIHLSKNNGEYNIARMKEVFKK